MEKKSAREKKVSLSAGCGGIDLFFSFITTIIEPLLFMPSLIINDDLVYQPWLFVLNLIFNDNYSNNRRYFSLKIKKNYKNATTHFATTGFFELSLFLVVF